MASVLIYSVFTAACGFAQTVAQLAVFRVLLGIGMGGEWASGAALVSETWPDEASRQGARVHAERVGDRLRRGRASSPCWCCRVWGWRGVFFVGILPAFFTLWVRRNVEEPRNLARQPAEQAGRARGSCFARHLRPADCCRLTIALTLMNACTMFGWWGFNLWLPGICRFPWRPGGMGFTSTVMSGLIVAMQVGMWFGYVTFGFVSDASAASAPTSSTP